MKGYMCISAKQSLHEPSCCKSRGETLPVGITSEVAHTTLVDYTDPCAAWGSVRDTNLHQSSLHTPHDPRHFERGEKVQLVQSVFIVWSLFLWAFSVPFLIWCLDVVLHYGEGFGEISRMFKETLSPIYKRNIFIWCAYQRSLFVTAMHCKMQPF